MRILAKLDQLVVVSLFAFVVLGSMGAWSRTNRRVPSTLQMSKGQRAPCQRYAYVNISREAGLGHRFGDLAFGALFAFQHNAEFVFDSNGFAATGNHGAYPWFAGYAGLDKLQTVSQILASGATVVQMQGWDKRYDGCNALIQGCDKCCLDLQSPGQEYVWCFRNKFAAYHMVQEQFRHLFHESDPSFRSTLTLIYNPSVLLHVAWHVRNGDIILQNEEAYFQTLLTEILSILAGRNYHIYFFAEQNLTTTHPFVNRFTNISVVADMPVELTFHHLVMADILVTSGSSFPAAAAVFNQGIVLQARAKNGIFGVQDLFDQVILHPNGKLLRPSLQDLQERIEAHLVQKQAHPK
jgi:hypothetical protein